jgi:HEAT repeat protein
MTRFLCPFFRSNPRSSRDERRWQTISAFEILGPEASPAVPDLERLTKNNKTIVPPILATEALGYIGKDGLPALIAALSDPNKTNRWRIIGAIGSIRNLDSNDRTAVLVLIKYLNDSDALLATTAAQSLGSLALQPDLAVPALTKVFKDPKSRLRIVSALSLSKFGEQARPAAPVLVEALRDPDTVVRAVALNTLKEVAPDIWEKARKDMDETNAAAKVQGP